MLKENESKEKMCLFFASDYHFEMITLPYINKNLKQNKDIVIVTENNLEKTVEKVIANINLQNEEKEDLENIDWNNNNSKKLRKIENLNNEGKDLIVFIKGKEDYIKNMNKNIKNLIKNEKTEIINCYDINEIQEDIKNIIKNYDNILSTSGIEKLL